MGALIEINTDGIAKLGETICNATGLSAYGYKKMANAKNYERIENSKVDTAIELEKLNGQAMVEEYHRIREKQKVENVAHIVDKAEQQFNEGEKVSGEPVDKDWVNRFFDYAEGVSDDEMQDIWAKILAGEVKQPKSYSLRTLDVLRNMNKEEAELFVKVSKNVFNGENIFSNEDDKDLDDLLRLNDIGLIFLESLNNNFEIQSNSSILLKLYKIYCLRIINENDKQITFSIPIYKLSTAGKELYKMLDTKTSDETINEIVKVIKSKGVSKVTLNYIISEQYGQIYSNKIKEF